MNTSTNRRPFRIQHHYDIGDHAVYIAAPEGFDARRAAVYVQFCTEEWYPGQADIVTNLGIAAALVAFYGCKHCAQTPLAEVIDMHVDRERLCPDGLALVADTSLHREGLKEFIGPFRDGMED
jgi:hypothetical protein